MLRPPVCGLMVWRSRTLAENKDGLRCEVDPIVLALHRAVKSALGPAGILNPGRAF